MRRILLALAVLLMVCFVVADTASARGRRCCGYYNGCCGCYSSCWDCGWGSCGYYTGCCDYNRNQCCYTTCGTTCCDHTVSCCQPNVPQKPMKQQAPPPPSR